MIDPVASERVGRYGVPACLRVPIAACDEAAIQAHVGDIVRVLSGNGTRRAFLVRAHAPPRLDEALPIWEEPGAGMLDQPLQVWVHRSYRAYGAAYRRAYPDTPRGDLVFSHAMNRRLAVHKGFEFVRLTPTSRGANSSSAFSEGWGIALHSTPGQIAVNQALGLKVQYADLTDLMLMMDMKLGGGFMGAVNEGQALIRPRTTRSVV